MLGWQGYILYDFEEDQIVTLAQLEQEYHENYKNGYIDPCTFSEYLNNCLYTHNGTIIPFRSESEYKQYIQQFVTILN